MADQRLPYVDADDGDWGDILNQFLSKEHVDTGLDNVLNGGHKTITVQAGTAAAGTAPIKLNSGALLSAPEAGAIEFLMDKIFFTQTTGTTRKTIAIYARKVMKKLSSAAMISPTNLTASPLENRALNFLGRGIIRWITPRDNGGRSRCWPCSLRRGHLCASRLLGSE